jgi:hypothetical protein
MLDLNYIQFLLTTNDRAVERGVLAIYNRQTSDEKVIGITRHTNGRGFNGPDSRVGTYYANWIIKGNRLTGRHLINARIMIMKYSKQLLEVALEKKKAAEKAAAESADKDSPESGSAET